jgi:DNA-binding NtrC family response regulator
MSGNGPNFQHLASGKEIIRRDVVYILCMARANNALFQEWAVSWRQELRKLADLAFSNPFSLQRIELERELLGREFVAEGSAWSRRGAHAAGERLNLEKIGVRAEATLRRVAEYVASGGELKREECEQYGDLVAYVLLYRQIAARTERELEEPKIVVGIWRSFRRDYIELAGILPEVAESLATAEHLFACLVQVHRAFLNIFDFIVGESPAIVALRAAVWQSIFTHDMRAYRDGLHGRMRDIPTLITGPTGTGKELVARAIGQSLYIPFDGGKERFLGSASQCFRPVNLAALSATLIESELFGHRRGAFTGAIADRVGWLEACPEYGAVFLDEIGELDGSLQVKLLRVTQQRTYCRIGETVEQVFSGKLIAATNRDLPREIQAGRFRQDLFYRLCADQVSTPSLFEQFSQQPDDLPALVKYIAGKQVGPELADRLAEHGMVWIARELGPDYAWPGNIRELEQTIRGVMLRGPELAHAVTKGPKASSRGLVVGGDLVWLEGAAACELSADELLGRYCTWAYFQLGTYERAAERLGVDRRTVKARIDTALLARLKELERR